MKKAVELLKEAPGERIFFTREPGKVLVENLFGKVLAFTGTHLPGDLLPLDAVRWSGVEAEPGIETVQKMISVLEAERPDTVVAAGGGSVLDAAKAAYLCYQTKAPIAELFGVNRWSGAHPGAHLRRVIALPTTSGTGSEATPYSNIVDRSLNVKKLISEAEIVPELAIVSPELAFSMPRELALATGCDALAHLIEGFLNVGADNNVPGANNWAKTGIQLIAEHLADSLAGKPDAREALALAAALGGMVNRFKSTGLPHLCSFSWFGRIAHGTAVAMLLPACWEFYLGNPAVAARTMELADVFPGKTQEEVIASYRAFLSRLGVPERLVDFPGITPELLRKTAESGAQNPMKLERAPRPVPLAQSGAILMDILKKSYGK